MTLSAIHQRYLVRIIPFGVIWLIFACLFLAVEYAAIGEQVHSETAIQITGPIIAFALTGITLIGCLVGAVEILYLQKLFSKKTFIVKIVSKLFIYLGFFFIIIIINFPIAASIELKTTIWDSKVWNKYYAFFFSITHLSTILQLSFSLLVSLLYAEIGEHLGHHVLLNFFTGKYHKPISENRIFMFADMKSSTSMAEELGHIVYFDLLQSYYHDLSNAIIKNKGEVYQYIGDEIVISWKLEEGIYNNNCINCFFQMKKDLQAQKEQYVQKYGMYPDFKAALHCGPVTTGEIGALKKEIFFTGDVLNTTSRIQGLCAAYQTDLLLSKTLLNQLRLPSCYSVKMVDQVHLRGKTEPLAIATIGLHGSS